MIGSKQSVNMRDNKSCGRPRSGERIDLCVSMKVSMSLSVPLIQMTCEALSALCKASISFSFRCFAWMIAVSITFLSASDGGSFEVSKRGTGASIGFWIPEERVRREKKPESRFPGNFDVDIEQY